MNTRVFRDCCEGRACALKVSLYNLGFLRSFSRQFGNYHLKNLIFENTPINFHSESYSSVQAWLRKFHIKLTVLFGFLLSMQRNKIIKPIDNGQCGHACLRSSGVSDHQVFVGNYSTVGAFHVPHLFGAISSRQVCSWGWLLIRAGGHNWNEQLLAVCSSHSNYDTHKHTPTTGN